MTTATADTTAPNVPASPDDAVLTREAVQTSPSPVVMEAEVPEVEKQDGEGPQAEAGNTASEKKAQEPDEDEDDDKESAPEPYDIDRCTLTFRVEIFPREADSTPRLALLAMNSHGDEPFKPRLVAFDGDFAALVSHMNGLYGELAAAMPEREAAAAKRAAEEKARKEAEEAGRKARLARTQNKRKRGGSNQTNLLAVPVDGPTATAPSSTRIPAKPAPLSVANPEQPPAPAEPEKKEDQNQFSLFL